MEERDQWFPGADRVPECDLPWLIFSTPGSYSLSKGDGNIDWAVPMFQTGTFYILSLFLIFGFIFKHFLLHKNKG